MFKSFVCWIYQFELAKKIIMSLSMFLFFFSKSTLYSIFPSLSASGGNVPYIQQFKSNELCDGGKSFAILCQ